MKYKDALEHIIDDIRLAIDYHEEGLDDCCSTIKSIGEICNRYEKKYICPYEKYTEEWYDEHGE